MGNIKTRLTKLEREAGSRGVQKIVVLFEGDPAPPDNPDTIIFRVCYVEGRGNDEGVLQ